MPQRNTLEPLRKIMEHYFQSVPSISVEFQRFPLISIVFQSVPVFSMEFHRIPLCSRVNYGTPWETLGIYRILWKSSNLHISPKFLEFFQGFSIVSSLVFMLQLFWYHYGKLQNYYGTLWDMFQSSSIELFRLGAYMYDFTESL